MTQPSASDLLTRYVELHPGAFRRADFLTWGAHHGLSRRTPSELIDAAFAMALGTGQIQSVDTPEARIHPLFQLARKAA